MRSGRNHFEFTGAVFRERKAFVSLCLDLDVASKGRSIREAKKKLAEAVELYLETCFESNVPYLRPVPKEEDPRFRPLDNLIETFSFGVDFRVHALA